MSTVAEKLTPEVYLCKGCKMAIEPGQLRRGDNWHAHCFQIVALEAPRTPRPLKRKGLTATQSIILQAAAASPSGAVGFGAGDRRGTRVVKIDDMGRPWIIAYSSPEFFLAGRGLLAKSNEPYVYRITDAGRAAIAKAEAKS